jgi:hypothetical protein
VSFPDLAIPPAPNSITTDVRLDVPADGRDLTVAIDQSGLAGVARVRPELTGCTTVGDTVTCPVPDERRRGFRLTVATAAPFTDLVPIGATGTLTIRATAANAPAGSHSAKVTVRPAIIDAVAVGSTATGKVGDTVGITVGLKSNGPDSLLKSFHNMGVGGIEVTLPPGVTVVSPDQFGYGCTGFGSTTHVGCGIYVTLPAGETATFRLDLRIDRVIRNATGKIVVHADGTDPNPANNTATIVINPTRGLPAPGLPVTGARTATLAATGALLVVLGTIGFTLARRRRHRFTAVDERDSRRARA